MSAHPPRWAVPFNRPDVPPLEAIAPDVAESLASGCLTKGPHLAAFEREAAEAIGTEHVLGVSSCTSGLMLALRAIARLGADCSATAGRRAFCPAAEGRDEVILPSFIFLAAPAAVHWAGLRPVFADVDPLSYTLDPDAVARALSPRTAAILGCHTFGCPCDMDRLGAIAAEAGVPLVIDAAHALGSEAGGKQVGGGSLAHVFSLSPSKLVVAGEGGLVATDCPCLARAVETGREYGNDGSYGCGQAGLNARLCEISAVLGRASLARLPATAAARRATAAAYAEALGDLPGIRFQAVPAGSLSSWKDFCIRVEAAETGLSRDALRVGLAEAGIDTRAYYSPPCHRMEAFAAAAAANPQPLPVTERLAGSLVALPMGSHVTPAVAGRVAEAVRRILGRGRKAVSA